VPPLAGAFQFEMGMRFRRRHYEMDCFLFTVGLSLTECCKLVGANRNDVGLSRLTFKPTTLQSSSLNKTDIS
jgi:hypothetical protein